MTNKVEELGLKNKETRTDVVKIVGMTLVLAGVLQEVLLRMMSY